MKVIYKMIKNMIKYNNWNNTDELIALAKTGGYEITKDEAEAYLAELADVELDNNALNKVAGGDCYHYCPPDCHHCPSDI